jgi:membrane protease YdiL (CAAX protease family)
MVTQNQTIGLSFLQLSGINAFAFIVIVAPVVEEWFFRWSIFPSFREQLKGLTPYYSVIALLIANVGFGIFHYYVYGANMGAVYVAAFLGIVYTIGNYALKSGTFSIGAHMTNNYLLWIAAGGMLG